MLLLVMAACAILSGTIGFALAKNGAIAPPGWVAARVPSAAYPHFMADWRAHSASDASGFFGGIGLCALVFKGRGRRP
jgi:hypothetical protein